VRNTLLIAALGALAVSTASLAKEKDGVTMPDTAQVDGKTLKLNGIGTRVKNIVFVGVNVYVAGIYLETPSKDPAQIIASDQTKRVVMVMLRDLERKAIIDAVRDGFQQNAGAQMAALKPRLDKFLALIDSDFKKGDKFVVTYRPGQGTFLSGAGEKAAIEGKDFADALFSVWLGKKPVDDDLKKALAAGG
jgi:hypothetical protein